MNTPTTTQKTAPTQPRPRLFTLRHDVKAAALEFLGTTCFLLLGLGGIQAAGSNSGSGVEKTMYVATSMGLSLLVSAWLFYRVTGGLFNPNVSFALWIIGGINTVRFVLYVIAQLAGGITGAALVRALTPGPFIVNVHLQNGVNKAQGVFIEMFITAALVLAVLMMAAEKHEATPFAPIGIGLTLFAGHLFALFYTGAAMNTARAFGPAAVSGFPYASQWIYWLGPFLGSLLGAAIYTMLKHYQYWTLNPNQAAVEPKMSPADPIITLKSRVGRRSNDETVGGGESTLEKSRASTDAGTSVDATSRRLNDSAV